MAKIKLQAKCSDILEQLYARAEQQLRAAFPLLPQDRLVRFSALSSFNKTEYWDNCFGAYCITLRFDESDQLLYHDHAECWYPLHWCKDVKALVDCADFLLKLANSTA